MDKIKTIMKKILTKEVIFYGIFGVLTTIINLISTDVLNKYCHINGAVASAIGIILSIIFAYFTNRKMVFNSTAVGFVENLKEFGKFVLGRAFTMVIEEGGVIVFNTLMNLPLMPVKIILTIIVIILNFFLSKFFAFTKKDKIENEQ